MICFASAIDDIIGDIIKIEFFPFQFDDGYFFLRLMFAKNFQEDCSITMEYGINRLSGWRVCCSEFSVIDCFTINGAEYLIRSSIEW